ncbi:MAG TPA: type 1 glutamine amidotransferase, partial [Euryarchaeota archaeon]|nr:type 1 glutamine amidotransferase [Euryarchaeota archaeon]
MKVLVLQHESCETLGVFEEELQKRDIQSRYVKVYEDDLPKSFKGFSKIIILGGPMNVYEEEKYPFLRA